MKSRIRLLTIGAASLFTLGVVAGIARSGPAKVHADSSSTPQNAVILRDASGQDALVVQLQAGRADTGAFDFYVVGKGDYLGTLTVQPLAGGIDALTMGTTTTLRFHPLDGSPATTVTGTINGTVNLSDDSAAVTVLADGTTYLLKTAQPDATAAATVAQQALTAMAAQDWNTVYAMAAQMITSQYTEQQFAQALTGQSVPTILSAVTNGTGQLMTPGDGYTYFVQPITVQIQKSDGTAVTYSSNLNLVLEAGQWKLLGTDATPPV
jgi:hypothetical protein